MSVEAVVNVNDLFVNIGVSQTAGMMLTGEYGWGVHSEKFEKEKATQPRGAPSITRC